MFFDSLQPTSKVWVYTSNKLLSDESSQYLQQKADLFVKDWAAHGVGLKAEALVYKNTFLILAVDESQANASGCSIDSSVKFIKAIGNELEIDFFDRLNLVVENNSGTLQKVHISDLKNHLEFKVYNPMITTLEQLRETWLIPVSSSPFV